MNYIKRTLATILMIVMLSQALPWTAFAATGDMITDAELNRALQLAGLQVASANGGNAIAKGTGPLRLEAKDSGYHEGMKPDETWDAQMLMDWLDDKLYRDIYNVTSVFTRAETRLEALETENPAAYAEFTANADYVDTCYKWALDAELAEEEARYFRKRLGEYTVVIETNTEMLSNSSDDLFDHEKIRYSEQIREAAEALEALRDDIMAFSTAQVLIIMAGQVMIDGDAAPEFSTGRLMIDGDAAPEFSAWLKAVLDSEEGTQEAAVPADSLKVASAGTRMSRLSAGERVLAKASSQDVTVQVVTENDFAIVVKGAENQPLSGVTVKVKDLNGSAERTIVTDDEFGSAVFNANDFVSDYDKEMELELTVDASAQGYRSFFIPWLIMKRGGVRTESLAMFEANANAIKPYIYSATFNGYDVVRNDKVTLISNANDATLNFEVQVENPSGKSYTPPVLYYWQNNGKQPAEVEQRSMEPTSSQRVSGTRTKYIYSNTWRNTLSPDITGSQKPYFVLPDTDEIVKTKLTPKWSSVDTPSIAATGPTSPLAQVMGGNFGLNFGIPGIGGNLKLDLPFLNYLPKVNFQPDGSVTVTFGSSLVDPKNPKEWKSAEQEKYDKAMKEFQHAKSIAQKKQQLGTGKDMYKKMFDANKGMGKVKLDFGWFLMFSGRAGLDKDEEEKWTAWSASGVAGMQIVFSADYTQPFTIGPVPFYVNFNFSLSAGFGIDGLFFTFYTDASGSLKNMEFQPLHGITLQFRLALTVSLGVGVKGIASLWVSATGALNIAVQLLYKQPEHISVVLELFVSVGFEIFWISYSRVILKIKPFTIYDNAEKAAARTPFSLFSAYAEEDDTQDDVDTVALEPERYPSLAPEAKKIISNQDDTRAGIKAVEVNGQTYVFYLTQSATKDSNGNTHRRIGWVNTATNQKGDLQAMLNGISYLLGTNYSKLRDDYAFDVKSDGNVIAIVASCASQFTDTGEPVESNLNNQNICYYVIALEPNAQGSLQLAGVEKRYQFAEDTLYQSTMNPIINAPRIEYFSVVEDRSGRTYDISGDFQSYSTSDPEKSGYATFYMQADHWGILTMAGDAYVQSSMGDQYRRVALRSGLLALGDFWDRVFYFTNIGFSWVALTRENGAEDGESAIEMYDWDMNIADVNDRKAIMLASGDIQSFEVLQSANADHTEYSQTIFYTQTETVGDRAQNHLKSIYIAPKKGSGTRNISFDITFTDYDVSLPIGDFKAVTLGASQYLYWLSTAPKEKDTDPDVWRITGVYYDSATGAMSDQIVIAEFSLPDSQWNGATYKSVPFEITLMESGTGYITAKPNVNSETERAIAPLTLYSFPITLKPVMSMQGAALMETTVSQGDFVAADMTMMNEGNMGIGSFDVDVVLLENGSEKQVVETLHADCLSPQNSRLVMHDNGRETTIATGESAFYRLKDFEYSPRQHEWNVSAGSKTFSIVSGKLEKTAVGNTDTHRIVTDVLVPGALVGYTGSIKIPGDWAGRKELRLKVTRVSTYSNWVGAMALASDMQARSGSGAKLMAKAANSTRFDQALSDAGIVKLVYALDESTGKLVLQNQGELLAAASETSAIAKATDAEPLRLYPTEIDAPESIDINCDVHDIDVDHRVYDDYYGDEMLEIVIGNYYANSEDVGLTCAVYVNDSDSPVYVSLPYDSSALASGRTTTITLPVAAVVDPETTESARFVITPRGIEETALINNEFTIYPGGASALKINRQPRSTASPAGGSAIFTVDVSGGKRPYRYQWQVFVDGEWKDIPGANEATLILENIKPEWNGRRTRCIITDAEGNQVVSDEAILTVVGNGDDDRPDTGDHTNLPLYLSVALIAITLLMLTRRRKVR